MAVVFTAQGNQYEYPTTLDDITFEQFINYLQRVLPREPKLIKDIKQSYEDEAVLMMERNKHTERENRPTKINERIAEIDEEVSKIQAERQDRINSMTELDHAKYLLPYYCRVISHFTGMPYEQIMGIDGEGMRKDYVEALYWIIQQALEIKEEDYEYLDKFQFEADWYYLPKRFMTNSTVIEFMESAQYQSHANEIRHGHYHSMLDVIAVLAKKKGEQYNSEVYTRNKAAFLRLPMRIVTNVAFFLMRRSEVLGTSSQIFTTALRLSRLKQEFSSSPTITAGTSLSKKLLMQGYLPFRPTMHSAQLN